MSLANFPFREQRGATHGNTEEDVQPVAAGRVREEAGIGRKVFHAGSKDVRNNQTWIRHGNIHMTDLSADD